MENDYVDDWFPDEDDISPVCPLCGCDDLNLKWFIPGDDDMSFEGRHMHCESCGHEFDEWENIY